jgi:hypothetical protein
VLFINKDITKFLKTFFQIIKLKTIGTKTSKFKSKALTIREDITATIRVIAEENGKN